MALERAWRRLHESVFILIATRNLGITVHAVTGHSLHAVSTFLHAGGKLSLECAQYEGAELQVRPDAWSGLAALVQLREHGAEIRKADDGFEISLPSGRIFELPSERLLAAALAVLHMRFIEDEYRALDVEGSVVIDVGANIGDSAVYFADKGAVHVYAFEPFLEPYSTAVRVVNRNQLDHKVTVIPRGVGARSGGGTGVYNRAHSTWGVASLDRPTPQPTAGRASNPTEEVQLVSLPSVLDEASKHYPGRPLALKMDCEGCEFEAFEGDGIRESLKAVRSIVLEAHGDEAMNKEIRQAYRQAGRSHSRESLWSKLEDSGFSVEQLSTSPGRSGRVLLLATRREGSAPRPSAAGPGNPAP